MMKASAKARGLVATVERLAVRHEESCLSSQRARIKPQLQQAKDELLAYIADLEQAPQG